MATPCATLVLRSWPGSLPTVELDADLCRIADTYCEEMVSNGYTGHFSLDGRTPYQRYV